MSAGGVLAAIMLVLMLMGMCSGEPMLSDTPASDNSGECHTLASGLSGQAWIDFMDACER